MMDPCEPGIESATGAAELQGPLADQISGLSRGHDVPELGARQALPEVVRCRGGMGRVVTWDDERRNLDPHNLFRIGSRGRIPIKETRPACSHNPAVSIHVLRGKGLRKGIATSYDRGPRTRLRIFPKTLSFL